MPKSVERIILTENVFVYGSLRKGYYNHDVLQSLPHKFLSKSQIKGEIFPTRFGFPCLMEGLGLVDGEVYAVDADSLDVLDWFEGHPNFYVRKEVQTTNGLSVWVYFGNEVQSAIIRPKEIPES